MADFVSTKTAFQCRRHYFSVYIDVDSFPLPTPAPEMAQVGGTRTRVKLR